MRRNLRAILAMAVSLMLWPLAAPAPAMAAIPTEGAGVNISDAKIDPPSVTIFTGTQVGFTNVGSKLHTATQTGGPIPFDTGGLDPNRNTGITFGLPGTYTYTSATDCLGGNNTPGFACGPYTIVVVDRGSVPTSPAAPGAPSAPVAAPGGAVANAIVSITDTTVSPKNLQVGVG